MSIRKRVSSGTAKGAPCNSSNAWTKVLRCVRTPAARPRMRQRRWSHLRRCIPVFPIVPDCSAMPVGFIITSSISIGPAAIVSRTKPEANQHTLQSPQSRPFRVPIQPQPDGHRRQPCGAIFPTTRITHHALHRLMNPSQRWPARTVRPSQAASRRPCNRPSTASNLPTCAMRRLPAIRST